MKDLVEYIAKSLVENPDTVQVTESTVSGRTVLNLRVEAADMGRVIGKQGRIAQAIRTLLKVAAVRSEAPDRQPTLVISSLEDEEAPEEGEPAPGEPEEDEPAGI